MQSLKGVQQPLHFLNLGFLGVHDVFSVPGWDLAGDLRSLSRRPAGPGVDGSTRFGPWPGLISRQRGFCPGLGSVSLGTVAVQDGLHLVDLLLLRLHDAFAELNDFRICDI